MTRHPDTPAEDREAAARFTRRFVIAFAVIEAIIIFGAIFFSTR